MKKGRSSVSMPKRHCKKHFRESEDIGSSDGGEQFGKLIAVGHGEKNSIDDDCVADKMHEEVICDEGGPRQRTKSCSSSMDVTPSADVILQAQPHFGHAGQHTLVISSVAVQAPRPRLGRSDAGSIKTHVVDFDKVPKRRTPPSVASVAPHQGFARGRRRGVNFRRDDRGHHSSEGHRNEGQTHVQCEGVP